MSEFLTAVHHKLPVKLIVYNNSAFGLIPLELVEVAERLKFAEQAVAETKKLQGVTTRPRPASRSDDALRCGRAVRL